MTTLILITASFLAGFQFNQLKINVKTSSTILYRLSIILIYIISIHMISEFKQSTYNLFENLKVVSFFTVFIFFFNVTGTLLFAKIFSVGNSNTNNTKTNISGLVYIVALILGLMTGFYVSLPEIISNITINLILVTMLFLIGHDLKSRSISLFDAVTNKIGIGLACIIIISSLLTSLIASFILKINPLVSIILSSGYGWYTLSSPLTSQVIGGIEGAEIFFIDIFRELIAFATIPALAKFNKIVPVGYCASSSFDFSLPALKAHLGDEIIPAAITSGLLLSIFTPVSIMSISMFYKYS